MSQLSSFFILEQVLNTLDEDLNKSTDWTGNLIPQHKSVLAGVKNNEEMVLCGKEFFNTTVLTCDKTAQIIWHFNDGDFIKANQVLCTVEGNARSLLTAERTALNFVQTLSATATITRKFVEKVKSTKAKIMDTRKTIPGLRIIQKYAVTVGGGHNQRFGLYDGILIKENHIKACGGIKSALRHAFELAPKGIPIQIEVENYAEFIEAVEARAELILLDNMTISEIEKCIEFNNGIAELEISGNVNLGNVLDYAKTGIDRISIGSLTKNIQAIDLSMRVIR